MYRNFMGICYSAEVKRMADKKGAYWLVDAISSHIVSNPEFKNRCQRDQRFQDMQIWVLSGFDDGAVLTAAADTTAQELFESEIRQEIGFTDFEFDLDEDGNRADYKLFSAQVDLGDRLAYYIFDPSEY